MKGNIFYYYGGLLPTYLEHKGPLVNFRLRLGVFLMRFFRLTSFSTSEYATMTSFRKNKVQVVLAQYGPTGIKLIRICKYLHIPLVVHFHGYDASVGQVLNDNGYYQEIFNHASAIIAVSKEMEKSLLSMGCPKEKLVYNPYGPKPEFLEIKPTFAKVQFVAVGRFTNKKAPYYTILAFKRVLEKYPESKLVIGGDGDLHEVCKNLVRYFDIEKNVEFPGVVKPAYFRDLLENSLAFVQHSVTASNGDMEGTPVAVLEASGAGLPVISTIHAGIPDVIIHDETGLLCDEHDVDTMGEHMIRLLEDVELAKLLGGNGKSRIKTYFSMEKHINVLQDVLERAVKNSLL